MAVQFIPQQDSYSIPTGFQTTQTSGGGTGYTSPTGDFYIRGSGGFELRNDLRPSGTPTAPQNTIASPTFTPGAVTTSSEPRTDYKQNTVYLATQTPALSSTQNAPITASSPNQTLQNIINQTNEVLAGVQKSGIQLTPENQALLSSINGLTPQIQSTAVKAQEAQTNGNVLDFNEYVKQLKELQTKQTQQLTDYYSKINPLREKYLASLNPSTQETDLQTQLTDLQKKESDYQLSLREGQQGEFGLGRPLELSTGRSEKLLQQSQNTIANFQSEEKNLLTRLGLAQDLRKSTSEGLKAGLGFAQSDLELQQKVQDKIIEQQKGVLELADKLNTQQRQQFADILSAFKGSDPSKLSPQAQAQLAQLAGARGIPYDMVISGLKASYDSEVADLLYKRAQTNKANDTRTPESKAISSAQANLLSSVGTDGFVNPNVYQREKANSTIGPDEFDKRFSYLLSPAERNRLNIGKNDSGSPSPDQQRTVQSWIANNPSEAKSIDQEKLKTDQVYFYWVLNKIQ